MKKNIIIALLAACSIGAQAQSQKQIEQLKELLVEKGFEHALHYQFNSGRFIRRHWTWDFSEQSDKNIPVAMAIDSIRNTFCKLSSEASESYLYEYHKDGIDTIQYAMTYINPAEKLWKHKSSSDGSVSYNNAREAASFKFIKEKDDIKEEGENIKETSVSKLLEELTNYKNEGCELYKQKKADEALLKFKEGFEKFEKEKPKIPKDATNTEDYKNLLLISKKILSNLALCYYKQGKYNEAIQYDMKLLESDPKFGKAIVRIFNSYSKLKQTQQAVYFGDMFLELAQDVRDKFKGTQDKIQQEKLKLKKIQKEEAEKIKKDFGKYVLPLVILCLAVFVYMLFKKK